MNYGMPESGSRHQILDAAERLFARQGFARTTIKQIGDEAHVNSALLYYYFGDKERLYHQVLGRVVQRLLSGPGARLQGRGTPVERLRAFVEAQAELLLAYPMIPKLLVRELIDHDAAHAVEQIQLVAGTAFKRLCDLIAAGQAEGTFRPELDSRFAAISVLAQVAYFFIARPAVRLLLGYGAEGPTPELVRAYARHAADFAVAALRRPRSPRRPASRNARARGSR